MRVLKDNSKNKREVHIEEPKTFVINCCECGSELEVVKEDLHIGWLGAQFVKCPCCGEDAIVDEIEGIKLTVDNLEFPTHFRRTNKDKKNVKEISPYEILKDIKRAIRYFRENKNEWAWSTSCGDMFLAIYRFAGDEEYEVVISKDHYQTYIPFEKCDYE